MGIAKRRWCAVAGIVAAGVGLATTEIVSTIVDRRRPSIIASVASRLVVAWAGPLKDLAVRLFGVHDKAALVAGIVVVSLACGALVGVCSRTRRSFVVVTFAAFALVGVWAAWRDPTASTPDALVSAIAGAIAGAGSLLALARITRGEERQLLVAARDMAAPVPTVRGEFDRRRFLAATSGLTALALGATATSQGLSRTTRSRRSNAAADNSLPVAKRTTPIPIDDAATTVDGLPPYVTPNETFYRIDTAIFVPRVDVTSWTLTIGGRVDRPRTYTYGDLLAMDLVEEPVTIACVSNDVGGHLVGNARWLGVPLSDLLGPAGVRAGATQIVGRSVDDFTVGIPTAQVLDGRVALVAVGMNGEPLPATHGYPARLIVAGLYGYASATKWLTELRLTTREEFDGFWIERGWTKDGPIQLASRIDVPESGQHVPAGRIRIAGMAWAPSIGISTVEVQIDDEPWMPARLRAVASPNTWVQWIYDWETTTKGDHVVAVRATDRRGHLQTDKPAPPQPSGATGYHYRGFAVV